MLHILGINPVAGVATTFKVRMQLPKEPEHELHRAIPAHALVQIHFPSDFQVNTDAVSSKRNIQMEEFGVVSIEKVTLRERLADSAPDHQETKQEAPQQGGQKDDQELEAEAEEKSEDNFCTKIVTVLTLGFPPPDEEETGGKKKKGSAPPKPEGTMMEAGATVSFVLNKIRNPCWSGQSDDFRLVIVDPLVTEEQEAEALRARAEAIANEQEVDESAVVRRTLIDETCAGNKIQPGSLESCSVQLEKLKIKKTGSARVSFQCFNPVPADGQIAVYFDQSFTGIDPTDVAVEEGIFGDVKVSVHDTNKNCVIIKRAPVEAPVEAKVAPPKAAEPEVSKGKKNKSKGAPETTAQAEVEEVEDDYDELVPKSHGGTRVIVQFNGISNPSTPGPRSKGALKDRLYEIVTLTSDDQVIDEERSVAASKFTTSVDLSAVMNFVFPPKQQHPNSTGRLLVYGL